MCEVKMITDFVSSPLNVYNFESSTQMKCVPIIMTNANDWI